MYTIRKRLNINTIIEWLSNQRSQSDLKTSDFSFADCSPWILRNGKICREDQSFFSVIGLTQKTNQSFVQCYIDQPEIGILAFVLTIVDEQVCIVLQAKEEPGNIEITQISPTIQATFSNYKQKHGGKPTKYLSHVLNPNQETSFINDSLQSEHGTKFYQKRNRNVVVFDSKLQLDESETYLLAQLEVVLALIDLDYAINTDARSVLASCDWKSLLCGTRLAFSKQNNQITASLFDSFHNHADNSEIEFRESIKLLQDSRKEYSPKANITDMTQKFIDSPDFSHQIKFINVTSSRREVEVWNQPIYQSSFVEKHILICSIVDYRMEFLIKVSPELGLASGVEFGPTFSFTDQKDVEELNPHFKYFKDNGLTELIAVNQSDEGGRFFKNVAAYEIHQIPSASLGSKIQNYLNSNGYIWVGAKTLNKLLQTQELTNNELRSVSSLIMKWL